ncbi:MAG TPA: hypothetical protein VF585_04955 [Chthoniobacterales bacterium]|jgi:hypothetical protein
MKKLLITTASIVCAAASALAGTFTTESTYVNPTVSGNFTFTPLITVGDRVPLTGGGAGADYAFTGIPDAMGIYLDPTTSEKILFVAHELGSGATTEPIPNATFLKGAFVSRYVLDNDGSVVRGGLAHKDLYNNNNLVMARPPQAGDAAAFTRFCSGSFAGPAQGMDRPIFLTNEESGSGNYNANGSQVVAVMDGAMHMLPDLGRVARETTVVMPRRDAITSIIFTEDGGNPSFVYQYVGAKLRRSDDKLAKNGLTGGKIYVLAGQNSGADSEATFTAGSTATKWVEIVNGASMNAAALSTAATAAGGFGFVRVEDADFDPIAPTRSMFVATTGGSTPNNLGRLYKLNFNPLDPKANGTLDVVYNADMIVTPGGDINAGTDFCVSVDNIAVTKDFILLCEDTNSPANAVYSKYNRNAGVWSLDRNNNNAAKLQGTFNYSYVQTRDAGSPTRPRGLWETSGVIDAAAFYGPGSFLINVQGHLTGGAASMRSNIPKPTGGVYTQAEAQARFAEDGQVLLMKLVP